MATYTNVFITLRKHSSLGAEINEILPLRFGTVVCTAVSCFSPILYDGFISNLIARDQSCHKSFELGSFIIELCSNLSISGYPMQWTPGNPQSFAHAMTFTNLPIQEKYFSPKKLPSTTEREI